MEELRSILIKHGYTGEIPDDLEDEKYKKLIQAIVNDLKSCDDLTGESKRRFDEMKRLSVECNKEQFQVILGKQKKQQLREIDRDKSQAAELEEREGPLKERLQALNHVHKHLTLQHEQCIRDKEKAILHLTECKKNYYKALDKSKEMNQMFNSSLNQLQHTLTDFFNFYADQSKIRDSNGKVTTPPLLSSLSPLPYFESEEIFTRTLSEYAKTKLPPGTASMADTSDIKEYSVLDDTQLIHRLSEEDYVKNSKELKRLESAYALVESQLLSYEVMKSFMKSSCKRLEDEIDLIKMGEGVIKTDVATLNQMIEAKEESLTELKAKYHNLSDNVLPKQLKELTSLRICRILHGDHDLKLARQNYYSSKQDEILTRLKEQGSRQELYSMLLEVEFRYHRDNHRLLLATLSQLEKWREESVDSQKRLEDLSSCSKVESIDEMDEDLMKLLDVKKSSLIDEHLSQISQKSKLIEAELIDRQHKLYKLMETLHSEIQELEGCIFEQDEDEKVVRMIPKDVECGIDKLQKLLATLEQGIKDILKDYEEKKKCLQASSLLQTEKSLFVYFFTDTEKLSKVMADLTQRVNALSIGNKN